MKWLEIAVYTTDAGLDSVCAALDSVGITGLSIEESRSAAAAFLRESVLYWDFADMSRIGTDRPCVKGYLADCPENVEKRSYAVCCWAFDRIREGGGLAIFAHPYWINNVWHVAEPFTRYMMKKHPFDAFEVLGGENYYEQNGFQTALYYDEYRQNRVHAIVGSTDTHGSTEHNRNADICSTIVFAHENERTDIVVSIRDKYSVAVDTISKEYRLVGEFRFQKYACFLMENWFPIHDRIAAMDGELMREYYLGEASAEELANVKAKADAQIEKYFVRA